MDRLPVSRAPHPDLRDAKRPILRRQAADKSPLAFDEGEHDHVRGAYLSASSKLAAPRVR
jgi:hypothetical protein